MNWTEMIRGDVEYTFGVTQNLMDMVEDDTLDWKPETGDNWMTVGQLLHHIASACGKCFRGFATGDWGFPEGMDPSAMKPEDMLPPAESLPSVASVAEARQLLAEDKQLALETLEQAGEDRLASEKASAPWDPMELLLGQRLLQMTAHLSSHKAQLFYYLKLQGKPVNTGHLWGM